MINSTINTQTISGTITLITTLIIVTPLCGFLFQCGCDWPWSGLDTDCNYQQHAAQQCPWCASMITGILSTGLAIMCGVCAAIFFKPSFALNQSIIEVSVRSLSGLTVFVGVAILTAGIAAIWQDYSIGVGCYLL